LQTFSFKLNDINIKNKSTRYSMKFIRCLKDEGEVFAGFTPRRCELCYFVVDCFQIHFLHALNPSLNLITFNTSSYPSHYLEFIFSSDISQRCELRTLISGAVNLVLQIHRCEPLCSSFVENPSSAYLTSSNSKE
jgi:hypothetical protein